MSSIEVLTVRLLGRAVIFSGAAVTSPVTSQGCCCGNLQIHPLDLGHNQLWVCEWEGPHMHIHTRVELVAAPGSLFLTRKLC